MRRVLPAAQTNTELASDQKMMHCCHTCYRNLLEHHGTKTEERRLIHSDFVCKNHKKHVSFKKRLID